MSNPPVGAPAEPEPTPSPSSDPRAEESASVITHTHGAADGSAPIAAMPIIEIGARSARSGQIEIDASGVHRSSVPPRPVPRPIGATSTSAPPARPVQGSFPPPSFPPPSLRPPANPAVPLAGLAGLAVSPTPRPQPTVGPAAEPAPASTATSGPALSAPGPAVASSLAPAGNAASPAPSFPPPSTPSTAPKSGTSADSDVDDDGYLRSEALHTLLDASELGSVRDAPRFSMTREAPAEDADDAADIPVEIGPELTAVDIEEPSVGASAEDAPASAPSTAGVDSSQDAVEVDIDAASAPEAAGGSELSPPPHAAPANAVASAASPETAAPPAATALPLASSPSAAPPAHPATSLQDPENHTFEAPSDRSSEVPTEVDPEDMEIEDIAATPARRPAAAPPVSTQPRSSGAEIAAVVEAQNAHETPAFKRTRYWWDELFGDDFLRTMDKPTDVQIHHEVNFIEDSLGVQKSGIVLDLACGSGRHAVEMASRGYSVVGYDLSVAMLARAADEAQERKQKLNFLHGDMRDMAFEEMFDGIYCWSTSFGYFDDDKNLLVAQNIHRSLRKGGMFLLDLVNRDFVAQRQPSLVWFEGEGCVCMDEMRVDFITSRLKVKRMVMLEDGRSRELDYSIRLYTLHELGRMLHEVGFKVTEVSGQPATRGVFMGADSPRLIVLAEKAG